MAPRLELLITMSARPVVAAGGEFVRHAEQLSDPGVALDWISDLRPHGEPLVLRVETSGGTEDERESLVGDWLCEADGSEPARLPPAVWDSGAASRTWSDGLTWLDAWERCENARWSLRAADRSGLDSRLVVRAACACARLSLHLVPTGEARPRRAVEAAEAWALGVGSREEMVAAADAAFACGGAYYDSEAGYDAACGAAYGAANVSQDPEDVAADVAYALSFGADDPRAETRRAMRQMADIVRANIPTIAVLRAVAGSDGAR